MARIFIAAGEPSGDLHAAAIASRLKDHELSGLAGDLLAKENCRNLFTLRETSVMGFIEIVRNYGRLRRMFAATCKFLKETKPDLLVLIDYPGFNIRLAKFAKSINIPTLYYIAPKTWAWGEWRALKMGSYIDRMAVIFPFEEKYFKKFGVSAKFVGNPNIESILRDAASVSPEGKTDNRALGILPGSRVQEISRMLPAFSDAARKLMDMGRFSRCYVSRADNIPESFFTELVQDKRFVIVNGSQAVFKAADFYFVKSGTATLEAALHLKPFVAAYKVSFITGLFTRLLLKIKNVTMVNIMLNETVVPELLQERLTSSNLLKETLGILDDENRMNKMAERFRELKTELLSRNPSDEVTAIIREMVNG